MYRVNLTEEKAKRLRGSGITEAFSILLEAAGVDLIMRYLAQPKPRPPLQVTLPAKCEVVEITAEFYAPEIQTKIDVRRIELGIDGDHAFALLGNDIQSGESEFVKIIEGTSRAELVAAKQALHKLRTRLGLPDQPYFFGNSHPYGNG